MTTTYILECVQCKQEQSINAHPRDVEKWRTGTLIQNALPYLTTDQREMFISGTCPKCWENIFGP